MEYDAGIWYVGSWSHEHDEVWLTEWVGEMKPGDFWLSSINLRLVDPNPSPNKDSWYCCPLGVGFGLREYVCDSGGSDLAGHMLPPPTGTAERIFVQVFNCPISSP